jgi:hypothetical protein
MKVANNFAILKDSWLSTAYDVQNITYTTTNPHILISGEFIPSNIAGYAYIFYSF